MKQYTLMAAQAHIAHIDAQLAEDGGHGSQGAVFIAVADHQCVVVAGEVHIDAVQLVDLNGAAAYGAGLYVQVRAVLPVQLDPGGIGVGVPELHIVDGEGETVLFRLVEGEGNAHIVRLHAQKAAHNGLLR